MCMCQEIKRASAVQFESPPYTALALGGAKGLEHIMPDTTPHQNGECVCDVMQPLQKQGVL